MERSIFPQISRKNPYYIVAPSYVRTSAGIKTLHYLCRALRQLGYEAYLVSNGLNIYLDTPRLTPDVINTHFQESLTPVVIYPEIITGNPLRAPFVVRYLMNYPGLLGGPKFFDKGDYLLSYAEGINPDAHGKERVLFFPASDTSIFFPPPQGAKRIGGCFYAGKYKDFHGGDLLPVTNGLYEITREDRSQTPQKIAEVFRESEIFYCYENSALSLEAMLCGCPVVLLPNKYFTTMIASKELGRDGLAWGMDSVEIERAKATVGKVWDNYQRLQTKFWTDLRSFIEETQTIAVTRSYVTPVSFVNPYVVPGGKLSKFFRMMNLVRTLFVSPPSFGDLISLFGEIRTDGYKGFKRKCKERELRFGKRFI